LCIRRRDRLPKKEVVTPNMFRKKAFRGRKKEGKMAPVSPAFSASPCALGESSLRNGKPEKGGKKNWKRPNGSPWTTNPHLAVGGSEGRKKKGEGGEKTYSDLPSTPAPNRKRGQRKEGAGQVFSPHNRSEEGGKKKGKKWRQRPTSPHLLLSCTRRCGGKSLPRR